MGGESESESEVWYILALALVLTHYTLIQDLKSKSSDQHPEFGPLALEKEWAKLRTVVNRWH
jgi:hypothetical protein